MSHMSNLALSLDIEYMELCAVLEREVTAAGMTRFQEDESFREETRRRAREAELTGSVYPVDYPAEQNERLFP